MKVELNNVELIICEKLKIKTTNHVTYIIKQDCPDDLCINRKHLKGTDTKNRTKK